MKKLLPFLLVLSVGCATSRQVKENRQMLFDECQYSDSALDPIRDKVVFLFSGDPKEQTPAMKADNSYISKSEKSVVALWMKKRNDCNKGEHNLFLLKNKQVVDDLLTLLYEGRITYGQFAIRREHIAQLALDVQFIEEAMKRNSKIYCGK